MPILAVEFLHLRIADQSQTQLSLGSSDDGENRLSDFFERAARNLFAGVPARAFNGHDRRGALCVRVSAR